LDFLKDREGDGVYEDDAAIDTGGVDYQDLLVVVGEAEEAGLGIVEGVLIVHADVVLTTLVRADGDALLWKAHILLDVPDL
jgi:hypothetical protein